MKASKAVGQELSKARSNMSGGALDTSKNATRQTSWWALLALLFAPVETASASLFVNDGNSGNCSQMLGSGLLGIQIPITIISHNACNANSLSTLISAGAANGTLALNTNGAFLIGNLHVNGALDLNSHMLSNLAAGVNAADAVNLGQLSAMSRTSATILGGGASVNADGTIGSASYTVQSTVVGDVGSALTLLDDGVTANTVGISGLNLRVSTNEGAISGLLAGTAGLVQQANPSAMVAVGAMSGGGAVSVMGLDGDRRITGVADATQSNDAVNLQQLQALQTQIGDVGALAVQYDDPGRSAITLGGIGAATPVTLRNVANGRNADDAANFGQLRGTAQSIASALGGSAAVDADGTLIAPAYNVQNTPVQDVGSALKVLDDGVTANTTGIGGLGVRVSDNESAIHGLMAGTSGLVQQSDLSAPVTVAAASGGRVVDVAGTEGDRRITGVADGTQDNDAANVGQLRTLQTQLGDAAALSVTYDDTNLASITFGGRTAVAPVALHNVADGVSAFDAVNYGQLSGLQNALQGQLASVNTQIGALDSRVSTLESGNGPSPQPGGQDPVTNPDYAGGVTVGDNAATGDGTAAAIGNNAQATGVHGTALGSDAYAASYHGTAVGGNASAASDGGVAVGANASAIAVAGTAVGEGATVSAAASNAVALGAGSIATQANSVSVGSAGNERTITNVAPGVDATDAVNVSQLQAAQSWAQSYTDQQAHALNERITRLGRRADAGTAAAIAMTNIPQAYAPDQNSLGAGVGSFRGQAAIAVGMSTVTPSGRWVLKASLSGTSQGDMGVGAGAAMVW
jgi:autotransporter adhesin